MEQDIIKKVNKIQVNLFAIIILGLLFSFVPMGIKAAYLSVKDGLLTAWGPTYCTQVYPAIYGNKIMEGEDVTGKAR